MTAERLRLGKQEAARLARECFHKRGQRGVMIVHLQDEPPFKSRLEYHPMDSDDGSESAETMRGMLEAYDPERQAVLYHHDAARDRAEAEIIDIDVSH